MGGLILEWRSKWTHMRSVLIGGGTALHSLAPKGRGWGEGVTTIPYRTARAPSSHLLPLGEKE
jgi:hypothetical protein